jgi:prevent-host-death family protein
MQRGDRRSKAYRQIHRCADRRLRVTQEIQPYFTSRGLSSTLEVMNVSVSQLKAHLGKYLRAVRQGRSVGITDRGEPVARLVPVEVAAARPRLAICRPRDPSAPALGSVRVRAIRWRGPSTMELLRDERGKR